MISMEDQIQIAMKFRGMETSSCWKDQGTFEYILKVR